MADVITETTRRSYGNRLAGSFGGVILGLLLFLGSFGVLWWNEGNFVRVARGLDEGKGAVVVLDAPKVKAENAAKLVHLSGQSETSETLKDPVFGISSQALLLNRKVEMFQWEETSESSSSESLGGTEETTTTYRYSKAWSDKAVASTDFKEPTGHVNPGTFPYSQDQRVAQGATLGEFTLSESVIKKIGGETAVSPAGFDVATVPGSQLNGDYIYLGKAPAAPEVGDVRVSFSAITPGVISVVAQQNGSTFSPFKTKTGSTIELVSRGTKSADEMFAAAEQANGIMTWIIRAVGFMAMWIGMTMILGPLSMLFAFIPFLKGVTGFFVSIGTFIVAVLLSSLTIALAWLFYRPLVSLAVIAAAVAIGWGLKALVLDKKKARVANAEPLPVQQPTPPVASQALPAAPTATVPQPAPVQPQTVAPQPPVVPVPPQAQPTPTVEPPQLPPTPPAA